MQRGEALFPPLSIRPGCACQSVMVMRVELSPCFCTRA